MAEVEFARERVAVSKQPSLIENFFGFAHGICFGAPAASAGAECDVPRHSAGQSDQHRFERGHAMEQF